MRAPRDLAAQMPERPARVLDLRTLIAIIGEYRWHLAFTMLAALAAARLILNTLPPAYTATAEIMLNNRATTVVDLPGVVGAPGGHDLARSEGRVLTSRRLVQRVIDRLHLSRDPEFGRNGPRGTGAFVEASTAVPPDHVSRERAALDLIERFRKQVTITHVPRTHSLEVSVTSEDPVKAALIANTLADLYIVDQLETKFDATRRASAWLNRRLAELADRLRRSEAAVASFRAEQALGAGQGTDATRQQMTDLSTQLVAARAAEAEADARARQVEARIREKGIAGAANVLSSELILSLRTSLAALVRREAELGSRYGPKHPRMIDLRAEISDTRTAIAREVRKIVEGLRNDAAVARARTRALEQSLAGLEAKSADLSKSTVHLNQLEREAEADREIYENFLTRVRQTQEQESLQAPDARILSAAVPPLEPSGPNVPKIVLLALFLGLVSGLGAICWLEATERRVRAGRELVEATAVPLAAILPPARRGRRPGRLWARQAAPLLEPLAPALGKCRVVAVTSSVDQEDGPATARHLAALVARRGQRTLLVELDPERPRYPRATERGARGVIALLTGRADITSAVVRYGHDRSDLLAMPRRADPSLLTPERLAALLGSLREIYDAIIIDAPPLLTETTGASMACALADHVFLAVRWRKTPLDAAAEAAGRLGRKPGEVSFILTRADLGAEARHAYGRFGDGYGRLQGARPQFA